MRHIGIALGLVLLVAAALPAQTTVKGDARAWDEIQAAYTRLGEAKTHRMTMGLAPGVASQGFEFSMTSEIVAPDRSKMTMRQADIAIQEVVIVGRDMRRRTTLLPRGQQMYDMQRSVFNQAFGGGISSIIGWITNPVGMAVSYVISQAASRMAQAATAGEEPGKWKCTQLAEGGGGSQSQSQAQADITVTKLADGNVEGARTQVYEMAMTERGRTNKTRMHVLADRGVPRRMEMFDESGKHLANMDFVDVGAAITIELPPCEQ
ncbi:MAG: hypothetical protein ACT4PY_07325 [Armatimonadota bacterium]